MGQRVHAFNAGAKHLSEVANQLLRSALHFTVPGNAFIGLDLDQNQGRVATDFMRGPACLFQGHLQWMRDNFSNFQRIAPSNTDKRRYDTGDVQSGTV